MKHQAAAYFQPSLPETSVQRNLKSETKTSSRLVAKCKSEDLREQKHEMALGNGSQKWIEALPEGTAQQENGAQGEEEVQSCGKDCEAVADHLMMDDGKT